MPRSELSSIVASVNAGSRNDLFPTGVNEAVSHLVSGKLGLAHGTEHGSFKGTRDKTEREINILADALPADWSAFTDEQRTLYYMETLSRRASQGARLIGEVFSNAVFPDEESAMEMGVVIQEIRNYRDDQPSTVIEAWKSLLYRGSAMAQPILGTEESVNSLTAADMREFYNRFYRGSNVLVTVVGKTRGLHRVIEESFGGLPAGPADNFQGTARYGEPGTLVITEDAEQAHFVIGVPGVALNDPRYYPLRIVEALLGGHCVTDLDISIPSSRLYDKLRVQSGTAYEVSSKLSAGLDTGYLAVQGMVEPRHLHSTLDIVKHEILGLGHTITRAEFERARNFWELYYLKKITSSLNIALMMSEPALLFNTIVQPVETIKRFQSVTFDEVRDVAEQLLTDGEIRLAVLGPFDESLNLISGFGIETDGRVYTSSTMTLDTPLSTDISTARV